MANIFDEMTMDEESITRPMQPQAEKLDVMSENEISSAPYTPKAIKTVAQDLLKYGWLEASQKPNLYQTAVVQKEAVNRILEPLDLHLKIDDIRGLAILMVSDTFNSAEGDEWTHPLIRRQRLNVEQSLLLAILRQHYVAYEQEAGIGAGNVSLALDDLLPQLKLYFGDSGSDVKDQKRLRNLLENLKAHGVVSEVNDKEKVIIRPMITHLANPETLQNLLLNFKQLANSSGQEEEST